MVVNGGLGFLLGSRNGLRSCNGCTTLGTMNFEWVDFRRGRTHTSTGLKKVNPLRGQEGREG